MDRAGQVLEGGLNNTMIPSYIHKPLTSNHSIRVLSLHAIDHANHIIHGFLGEVDLWASPGFKALSYTWGSALELTEEDNNVSSENVFTLIISEPIEDLEESPALKTLGRIELQPNLSHFLQLHFDTVMSALEPIWVDAICINQVGNGEEKQSQILLMGDIYSRASTVYIWLGSSSEQFDCFEWIHKTVLPPLTVWSNNSNHLFKPLEESFWREEMSLDKFREDMTWEQCWKSYFNFFKQRRWFRRGWIIQEVAFAKRPVVVCHKSFLSWTDLEDLNLRIFDEPDFRGMVSEHGPFPPACLGSIRHEVQRIVQPDPQDRMPRWVKFWLMNIERVRQDFSTTYPEDMIHCILALVKRFMPSDQIASTLGTLPVAGSARDIYLWASNIIITAGGTQLLALVTESSYERKVQNLPSWVPDWSVYRRMSSFTFYHPMGSKDIKWSSLPHAVEDMLFLQGVPIDTISTCCKKDRWDISWFWSALELVLGLGPIYRWTGQKILEALWRTLIMDCSVVGHSFPAHEAHSFLFRAMANQFLAWDLRYRASNKELDTFCSSYDTLRQQVGEPQPESESTTDSEHLLPSLIQILEIAGDLQVPIWDPLSVTFQMGMHVTNDPELMGFPIVSQDKKLYITSEGLLGMGSEELSTGDEIWVFEGLSMPAILRKVSNDEEGWRHQFMGVTYVHGAMTGDMITMERIAKLQTVRII